MMRLVVNFRPAYSAESGEGAKRTNASPNLQARQVFMRCAGVAQRKLRCAIQMTRLAIKGGSREQISHGNSSLWRRQRRGELRGRQIDLLRIAEPIRLRRVRHGPAIHLELAVYEVEDPVVLDAHPRIQ